MLIQPIFFLPSLPPSPPANCLRIPLPPASPVETTGQAQSQGATLAPQSAHRHHQDDAMAPPASLISLQNRLASMGSPAPAASPIASPRGVGSPGRQPAQPGAAALRDQLNELRTESHVLMQLQNRLESSIELLKLHKKHTVGAIDGGAPAPTAAASPQMVAASAEPPEVLQFMSSLGAGGAPKASPGVPKTAAASPTQPRVLDFGTTGLGARSAPAPSHHATTRTHTHGGGYYGSAPRPDLATGSRTQWTRSGASRATAADVSAASDDDLSRQVRTQTVELDSAMSRMAKQELEIYLLKQQCRQLERDLSQSEWRKGLAANAAVAPPRLQAPAPSRSPASAIRSPPPADPKETSILRRWGLGSDGAKPPSPLMADADMDLGLRIARGALAPYTSPSQQSTARERRLQADLTQKERELAAMGHTMDGLMSDKRGAKTKRERDLEAVIQMKDRELNEMGATLEQLIASPQLAASISPNRMGTPSPSGARGFGGGYASARDAEREAAEELLAAAAAAGRDDSPIRETIPDVSFAPHGALGWRGGDAGASAAALSPDDTFGELRMASAKLRQAQDRLRRHMGGRR